MACITYVSDGGSNVVGIEASIDDMPRVAKAEGVFWTHKAETMGHNNVLDPWVI